MREVARARANRNIDKTLGSRQRRRDTCIDHFERNAGHAAERVNRSAACQEVRHHLRGHGLRIRAHPFLCDAMVAGKHDHGRALYRGMRRFLDQAHLPSQRFEPPQAAGRLGLRVDQVLQRAEQRLVERFDHR
jgi:hypothetical protein